jgi:hypothetical protein
MAGGPAMGEDATDYFVRTPGNLRKSVLFDEKEQRAVNARLGDRKVRVANYGDGRYTPRLSALEYLCHLSRASIATPFQRVRVRAGRNPLHLDTPLDAGRHPGRPWMKDWWARSPSN